MWQNAKPKSIAYIVEFFESERGWEGKESLVSGFQVAYSPVKERERKRMDG